MGNNLLENKTAVIFGAGGGIGSGIAREFAKEGASLFLSGRNLDSVKKLANEIHALGGKAEVAYVDALDEQAVNTYFDDLSKQVDKIDIVFNATGPKPHEYDNGITTLELDYEKFLLPMDTYTASNFLTTRSAVRHMLPQKSGVILYVTANPSQGIGRFAPIGAAMGAIEAMFRCFTDEWSPSGIRFVGIRSHGMIDTNTIQHTFDLWAKMDGVAKDDLLAGVTEATRLKLFPVVDDTAKIAAFAVSDRARTLTGTIINATSGSLLD